MPDPWSIFIARPKGAAARELDRKIAMIGAVSDPESLMIDLSRGFSRVSLVAPSRPLSRHRRVISTAILVLVPVLVGAEIVHRWVLLAGVADLQLSVDSPRGVMSVGS